MCEVWSGNMANTEHELSISSKCYEGKFQSFSSVQCAGSIIKGKAAVPSGWLFRALLWGILDINLCIICYRSCIIHVNSCYKLWQT